jgi:hypothetical protein
MEAIGLVQQKQLKPRLLGYLRGSTWLMQFITLSAKNPRLPNAANGIRQLGSGQVFPIDATEVVADVAAGAGQKIAGIPVKEETKADDTQNDDKDCLGLAAKELHHKAAKLPITTERENMIVA